MNATCAKCSKTKATSEFYPDKTKAAGHHSVCKECVKTSRKARYAADPGKHAVQARKYALSDKGKASVRRRWEALRDAALDAYGRKCACCGESSWEFLTVDHVGGWGSDHRKVVGEGTGNMYQWLKNNDYPQDGTIQLLCWNCNCAMGVRGYCPHQELT